MNTTFTPGPWSVDAYGDVIANGGTVADMPSSSWTPQPSGECGDPDANLIADAPELLAALIELRDWYTAHTRLPACAANAAIAKAIGETLEAKS